MNTTEHDPLFTTRDAAAYLGISAPTLERYRLTGRPAIPYVKYPGVRGPVRYRKSDLDRFLATSMRSTSEREAS